MCVDARQASVLFDDGDRLEGCGETVEEVANKVPGALQLVQREVGDVGVFDGTSLDPQHTEVRGGEQEGGLLDRHAQRLEAGQVHKVGVFVDAHINGHQRGGEVGEQHFVEGEGGELGEAREVHGRLLDPAFAIDPSPRDGQPPETRREGWAAEAGRRDVQGRQCGVWMESEGEVLRGRIVERREPPVGPGDMCEMVGQSKCNRRVWRTSPWA
mgnify:CR=1 FL=1